MCSRILYLFSSKEMFGTEFYYFKPLTDSYGSDAIFLYISLAISLDISLSTTNSYALISTAASA